MKKDLFFKKMEKLGLALTYSDVRLRTDFSDILPADTVTETMFSRNVPLKIPIVGSPMDTITESSMAIKLAKLGGLGIIHKGLSPKKQALEVSKVKYHLNGMIKNPICINPEDAVKEILDLRKEKNFRFHSFPVIDKEGKLIGIVTEDDFSFCNNQDDKIEKIMSTKLITEEGNISIIEAFEKMTTNRVKILPLTNSKKLTGLYVLSDVKRIVNGKSVNFNLDSSGSLIVGAAIGVGDDAEERMNLLSKEKVDVIVIDTAHGNSQAVIDTIKFCKKKYPHIDVVAGNISEAEAAQKLVKAGVDGLKVGQGPGSICTTRIVAGIGCPQVTAVFNCSKKVRKLNVPICADGGIEYSGDITIALASGASTVMLGKALAGTEETPGDTISKTDGRLVKFYRGMGSAGAMRDSKASRERYGQGQKNSKDKFVPEGVETEIPYKGSVSEIIFQLQGGLKSGMAYLGAKNIVKLQEKADFFRISSNGLKESHPHGITITKDVPNYN